MKLQPHLKNVTELILQANKDSDDEVALEACEFWYVFCNLSVLMAAQGVHLEILTKKLLFDIKDYLNLTCITVMAFPVITI